MKKIILITALVVSAIAFISDSNTCSLAQNQSDLGPKRLVVIRGKATITNHPELGTVPYSGGTIIFQKESCTSCYVATNAGLDGKYEITVGDGKYRIIVRNPSSPEFDMLLPNQERFVNTESDHAKAYSKQVFDLDVKIRLPEK